MVVRPRFRVLQVRQPEYRFGALGFRFPIPPFWDIAPPCDAIRIGSRRVYRCRFVVAGWDWHKADLLVGRAFAFFLSRFKYGNA